MKKIMPLYINLKYSLHPLALIRALELKGEKTYPYLMSPAGYNEDEETLYEFIYLENDELEKYDGYTDGIMYFSEKPSSERATVVYESFFNDFEEGTPFHKIPQTVWPEVKKEVTEDVEIIQAFEELGDLFDKDIKVYEIPDGYDFVKIGHDYGPPSIIIGKELSIL